MKVNAAFLFLCGVSFFLASCNSSAARRAQSESTSGPSATAILNVNVVPMDSQRVLQRQTVLIEGRRISRIGPAGSFALPGQARKIEAAGRYLIPGLADMHVHFGRGRQTAGESVRLLVTQGVTTALSLGGSLALWQRARIEAGEEDGPRIFAAQIFNDRQMTFEQGKQAVQRASQQGYDMAKVYTFLSAQGFQGIAQQARLSGMPVVGHIVREVGLPASLQAGQAMIAHAEEITYNPPFRVRYSKPEEPAQLDPDRIPEVAELLRQNGVWLVPTLEAFQTIIDQCSDLDALLARQPMKYVSARTRQANAWLPPHNDRINRLSGPAQLDLLRRGLDFQFRLVRELHQAGVGILAGTDLGLPGIVAGFSLHDELSNFVEAGLTPFEALQAATRSPAEFLGLGHDFGTVEEGKRADGSAGGQSASGHRTAPPHRRSHAQRAVDLPEGD